jgi:hypothetical protein
MNRTCLTAEGAVNQFTTPNRRPGLSFVGLVRIIQIFTSQASTDCSINCKASWYS